MSKQMSKKNQRHGNKEQINRDQRGGGREIRREKPMSKGPMDKDNGRELSLGAGNG